MVPLISGRNIKKVKASIHISLQKTKKAASENSITVVGKQLRMRRCKASGIPAGRAAPLWETKLRDYGV